MENTLTVAELKRRGAAAIEDGLKRGPIHILKRNRSAAVVLSEGEYQRLLTARTRKIPGMTAMQWLLAHPASGRLGKRQIDRRLRSERDW
ncbi:MAG TPA: hypothetical protein VFY97_06500 [Rhodanobacteraceae bacterium]|nr:hypothetical protein [Rhodanobacteraceae bacterium]